MTVTAPLSLDHFLAGGFDLRQQLGAHLSLSAAELERQLPLATEALAAAHPGAFNPDQAGSFYENEVGHAHLLELAAWHLSSADYIADTLRLQAMFAKGHVLDFGGGIGTHALAAAALPAVEAVWFVDLNPANRAFVTERAERFGNFKLHLAEASKRAEGFQTPGWAVECEMSHEKSLKNHYENIENMH